MATIKFVAEKQVDIIGLFLHDRCDCWPFNEGAIANALNAMFETHMPGRGVTVTGPADNGLSRFTIVIGEMEFTGRCYTEEQLERLLPTTIFQTLKSFDGYQKAILH